MKITITWRNDNPDTVWNVLARKLGREPTNDEATAEVKRIFDKVTVEMAEAGKLPHQRGRLVG
jgi:ABC-type Fe2+-enterobactin transport system substrate-binding protein